MFRQDEVIWREVDGRVVGIDLRASRYFSLNPTGTLLWKLLAEGAAAEELTDKLAADYSLDRDLAARDVSTFLASLEGGGLLES